MTIPGKKKSDTWSQKIPLTLLAIFQLDQSQKQEDFELIKEKSIVLQIIANPQWSGGGFA